MRHPTRKAGIWRAVLALVSSTLVTALWLWGFYLYVHPPPAQQALGSLLGGPVRILPPVYLAPFYAIARAIPDKLTGSTAGVAAIFLFSLLPWILTINWRRRLGRPIAAILLLLCLLSVAMLTIAGWRLPDEPLFGNDPGLILLDEGVKTWLWLSRVAAAYFFAYVLLIAPLLGREDRREVVRTFD